MNGAGSMLVAKGSSLAKLLELGDGGEHTANSRRHVLLQRPQLLHGQAHVITVTIAKNKCFCCSPHAHWCPHLRQFVQVICRGHKLGFYLVPALTRQKTYVTPICRSIWVDDDVQLVIKGALDGHTVPRLKVVLPYVSTCILTPSIYWIMQDLTRADKNSAPNYNSLIEQSAAGWLAVAFAARSQLRRN